MNQRVGIVGAGLIGRSWAIVFARAGYDVSIHDNAPHALAAAEKALGESLRELSQQGLLSEPPDRILARISPVGALREAIENAVLVQENVRETQEAKQAIFSGDGPVFRS
jgi:3-hydroxyacyl-CoA dehydrogenase